jgi:hypothetical protein
MLPGFKEEKSPIKIEHNLYDALGSTLLSSLYQQHYRGAIDTDLLQDTFLKDLSASIGFDLGKGYNLDVGYNKRLGSRKQDIKLGITKAIF